MMTVNEVSKLAGVSIRTLQYYDKIGLLKPARYTESGYRLYDDTGLERLQQILLFRELEFPLKEIKEIIPGSLPVEARLIKVADFMRKRYGSTMIQALKTVLPVKQKIRRQTRTMVRLAISLLERLVLHWGRTTLVSSGIFQGLLLALSMIPWISPP